MPNPHTPVLLEKVIELLAPQAGDRYFDGTAGYGGHAEAMIRRITPGGSALLVDRDAASVTALRDQFGGSPDVEIRQQSFAQAAQQSREEGRQFEIILLDLGVSSPQLDNLERGFSFKGKAPLDMRMDQRQTLTAGDLVNSWSERQLADVIYDYGEERRSRAVARAIVAERPIGDTEQLARLVRRVVRQTGHIDAATRTFQALRIAVNSELDQLSQTLSLLPDILADGGRLAVISFHSLEDRLVKQFIDRETRDCVCPPEQPVCICEHTATLAKLAKKPIRGELHDVYNPRARSAILRAAVNLKQKQKEVRRDR
jgi:16S rRNA (cytosine1402-N4)-methyltransferase